MIEERRGCHEISIFMLTARSVFGQYFHDFCIRDVVEHTALPLSLAQTLSLHEFGGEKRSLTWPHFSSSGEGLPLDV